MLRAETHSAAARDVLAWPLLANQRTLQHWAKAAQLHCCTAVRSAALFEIRYLWNCASDCFVPMLQMPCYCTISRLRPSDRFRFMRVWQGCSCSE